MTIESSRPTFLKRWRWAIAGTLVVLIGAGAGAAVSLRKPKVDDQAKVQPTLEFGPGETVRLESKPLAQSLYVTGELNAVQRVTLRAKVSAEVKTLAVREGDRVTAGQLIAQLDTNDLEARLAERVGSLEAAKANLAQAQRNRVTNQELLSKGYISKNAFETIDTGFQATTGQMQAAEGSVAQIRNSIRDARVVAPISGIVAKRHVQAGEKVAIDMPLVSIVDLAKLEMQALVPADEVPKVQVGSVAKLKIDGYPDRVFDGKVERIAPATEPGTRAVLVLVGLTNPGELLKAGMFATGTLAIGQSQPVPTLPTEAVVASGGDTSVWMVRDGKLTRQPVRIGRRDENTARVEVVEGLGPNDRVLSARFDNLREGQPARVVEGTPQQTRSALAPPIGPVSSTTLD
ncbi:efflux RND transporter periplasmic adaptor subunit [soil metagenome]